MLSFLMTNRFLRHTLFWVGVLVYFLMPQWIYPDYITTIGHYFFYINYTQSPYFLIILVGYVLGVGMIYAYSFLKWVMPCWLSGRYAVCVGRYLLLTVGICYFFRFMKALHMAVIDPWLRHQSIKPLDMRHFNDFFVNQVYIHEYSTVILVLAVYKLLTNWRQKQRETNRLMQEQIKTRIQLLKTQVNPGFMINSLTNLQGLIDRSDKQAPGVVLKLAQFLSYVLYESQAEKVSLERDIEAMQTYIHLEKQRFGEHIDMSVSISGNITGQFTPPLIWLPFLENAFQHGRAEGEQAWITLNVSVAQTKDTKGPANASDEPVDQAEPLPCLNQAHLRFTLANSAEPESDDFIFFEMKNGLKAVQQRLETLYQGQYQLKFDAQPGVFLVVLTIPLATTLHNPNPLEHIVRLPYETTVSHR
jgi:two-component system LytT family sensor kinase